MYFRKTVVLISLGLSCSLAQIQSISAVAHVPEMIDSASQALLPLDWSAETEGAMRICFSRHYAQDLAYIWPAPHPVYGDTAWAQRFSVAQPETLISVELYVYDWQNGTFGNDDIYITIYDDDGSNLPGAELARVTIPAGTYSAFPALTIANFMSFNLVFENDYHVAFSTSAVPGVDYEYLVSSSGEDGTGRSSGSGDPNWPGGSSWYSVLSWWGLDVNFFFRVNVCSDQYTRCGTNSCSVSLSKRWALPDATGIAIFAQKNQFHQDTCRIDKIRFRLAWPIVEAALPLYSYDTEVHIYDDSGGIPGVKLATITIGEEEYSEVGLTQPTGTKVLVADFAPLQLFVAGNYWVGIESLAPDSTSGIRILSDSGDGACVNGFARFDSGWEYVSEAAGHPEEIALGITFGYCCKPPTLIEIPNHYSTIQGGIVAAYNGDTVLVHPGTYSETITFNGKMVTVASLFLTTGDTSYISSTIINGDVNGPTVSFSDYENDSSKLIGLTVSHQSGFAGEGIYCVFSSPKIKYNYIINNVGSGINAQSAGPTIEENLIEGNVSLYGGAIYVSSGNSVVNSNRIIGNRAKKGAGVYLDEGSFTFMNNTIYENTADSGSAIYVGRSTIFISNCTISGNTAESTGVIHLWGANIEVDNSIIAFNSSPQATWYCEGNVTHYSVNCTDMFGNSGGDWNLCGTAVNSGFGNISLNPLFCNVLTGDFSLNEYSPCATANSPCKSLIGSLDVSCTYLCGDADGNSIIDINDVTFIQNYYFECIGAPAYYGAADPNCDGKVNFVDALYLADYLNSNGPPPCCP